MRQVILNFDYDSDMIMCPDEIAEHISRYQRKFDRWISNKKNHHGYWTKDSERKDALSFDSDAFINYLNTAVIEKEEDHAYIIKRAFFPSKEEGELPHINF